MMYQKKSFLVIMAAAVLMMAGCSKQEKEPKDMSFDELKTKAMVALNSKHSENAIEYLEQIITQHPENQDIFEYKFMLADLYLKMGKLEAAYRLYKNYTKFYPAEAKAEDAHYKSILAKYYQALKVSRSCDESDTKRAANRCRTYLVNAQYRKYRGEVRDILYTCERRLIDKEIYVFNTYLKRNKLQSAQNRLEYLRNSFVSRHPGLEAQILYLEIKLAHQQKNEELVRKTFDRLFTKFPNSEYIKLAQQALTERKFIF